MPATIDKHKKILMNYICREDSDIFENSPKRPRTGSAKRRSTGAAIFTGKIKFQCLDILVMINVHFII